MSEQFILSLKGGRMNGKMHSARLSNSARLQRVYEFLKDGNWHSTLEIVTGARVCAVNSAIAEIRDNGHGVECQRTGDIWRYRMVI
jgi:hypothetical protein